MPLFGSVSILAFGTSSVRTCAKVMPDLDVAATTDIQIAKTLRDGRTRGKENVSASLLGPELFGLINLLSHLTLRRWHASEQAQ